MSKKVAILDDELIARNRLRSLLEQQESLELVLSTADPYEVLGYLEEHNLDLIFLDMNMPGLTGLEFLAQLQAVDQTAKVIIVSGYSDFEYAKGALRYGTVDYVLKHELSEEVIEGCLQRLNFFTEESVPIKNESAYQKADLFDSTYASEAERILQQLVPNFRPLKMVSFILHPTGISHKIWDQTSYRKKSVIFLQDLLNAVLSDQYPFVTNITPQGTLLCLVSFAKIQSNLEIHDFLTRLMTKLRNSVKRMLDIQLFCKISDPMNDLKQALAMFYNQTDYLEELFYSTKATAVIYGDKRLPKGSLPNSQLFSFLLAQLKVDCAYLDIEHFQAHLTECFGTLAEVKLSKRQAVEQILSLQEVIGFAWEQPAKSPLTDPKQILLVYDTLEDIKLTFMEKANNQMQQRKQQYLQQHDQLIFDCITYINQNYTQEISLRSCAQAINVNYSYLSRIFKAHLAEGFTRYVNGLRVERAKNYLRYEYLPIAEIVVACGFSSYNYFFKVFKEYTGHSPNIFSKLKPAEAK